MHWGKLIQREKTMFYGRTKGSADCPANQVNRDQIVVARRSARGGGGGYGGRQRTRNAETKQ